MDRKVGNKCTSCGIDYSFSPSVMKKSTRKDAPKDKKSFAFVFSSTFHAWNQILLSNHHHRQLEEIADKRDSRGQVDEIRPSVEFHRLFVHSSLWSIFNSLLCPHLIFLWNSNSSPPPPSPGDYVRLGLRLRFPPETDQSFLPLPWSLDDLTSKKNRIKRTRNPDLLILVIHSAVCLLVFCWAIIGCASVAHATTLWWMSLISLLGAASCISIWIIAQLRLERAIDRGAKDRVGTLFYNRGALATEAA